jgi:two-component system response regulator
MSGPPTLLLVDDNGNQVSIALRAFDRAGLEAKVRVEPDGVGALRYLGIDGEVSDEPPTIPRVVFLDLNMPSMDGWEVLHRIRSHHRTRDLPVVVLSSSSDPESIQRCYSAGANSFVLKRFDVLHPGDYLVTAAQYWLELNEPHSTSGEGP